MKERITRRMFAVLMAFVMAFALLVPFSVQAAAVPNLNFGRVSTWGDGVGPVPSLASGRVSAGFGTSPTRFYRATTVDGEDVWIWLQQIMSSSDILHMQVGNNVTQVNMAPGSSVTISNGSYTFSVSSWVEGGGIGHAILASTIETIALPASLRNVTITNGRAGNNATPPQAAAGASVVINAGTPPAGQQFAGWTSTSGVNFFDSASIITTFTMPAGTGDVVVTASWEPITPASNNITVIGGTGANANPNPATAGTVVSIQAGTPPTGQQFSHWTSSSGVIIASTNSANTSFTMPSGTGTVTVQAHFEPISPASNNITVIGGTGANANPNPATAGTVVSIHAGTPPAGQQFSHWTSSGIIITNINSANTTFTMPSGTVTVQAHFEPISPASNNITIVDGGWGNSASPNPAAANALVTINAGTPPAGQQFAGWTTNVPNVIFANSANATTTFIMPSGSNPVIVTANWTPISTSNNIVIMGGGGGYNANPNPAVANAIVTINAGTPPAGQQFAGWSTNVPNVNFANPASATTTFVMPSGTGTVIVTANWVPISNNIIIINGGGGHIANPNPAAANAIVTINAGTPPAGQQFVNWTTTTPFVNFADANSATTTFVMPPGTGNVIITANWTSVAQDPQGPFIVTFNPNGGTRTGGGALNQSVAGGGNVNLSNLPIVERAGYEFLNWTPLAWLTNVTSNITLTAVWAPLPPHTVIFDLNGGTHAGGGSLTQTVPHGSNAAPPAVTRLGFTFNGWTWPSTGGGYTNVTSGPRTITAQWIAQGPFTVTFDVNGGTHTGGGALVQNNVAHGGNANLPEVTRVGYTLVGWSPAGSHQNVMSDRTLVAHWAPVGHFGVIFDLNGGSYAGNQSLLVQTVVSGGNATALSGNPTRSGFVFTGWSPTVNLNNVTNHRIFVAQWVPLFTVTFALNGGIYAGNQNLLSQTIVSGNNATQLTTNPTRPGFVFAGWSPTLNLTNVNANRTFTAQWTPQGTITVTFALNGGTRTGGGELTQAVTSGSNAVMPTVTRPGHHLTWAPIGDYLNITSSRTINAHWTPYGQHTVGFNLNGGSYAGNQNILVQAIVPGANATALSANPTRAGFTFNGWNPALNLTNVNANRIFVAQWIPATGTHAVVFNLAGGVYAGEQTRLSQSVNHGANALPLTVNPTRAGFNFNGWSPTLNLNNVTEARTFVAQWSTLGPFTVTFNLSGGNINGAIVDVVRTNVPHGTNAVLPAHPTRAGYVFLGWLPTGGYMNVSANTTLTASWAPATPPMRTVTYSVAAGQGTLTASAISTPLASGHSTFQGAVASFTATPATGWRVQSWTINGSSLTGYTNSTLRHANIGASNINVTVTFELITGATATPTPSPSDAHGWHGAAGFRRISARLANHGHNAVLNFHRYDVGHQGAFVSDMLRRDGINTVFVPNEIHNLTVSVDGRASNLVPTLIRVYVGDLNLSEEQMLMLRGFVFDYENGIYNLIPGSFSQSRRYFYFEFTGSGVIGAMIYELPTPLLRLNIGTYRYYLNGVPRTSDVAPFISFNRTMVPIRIIAEALGATPYWNNNTRTAYIFNTDGTVLRLPAGQPLPHGMGTPIMANNRILVPARFVIENFDAITLWDPLLREVTVYNLPIV